MASNPPGECCTIGVKHEGTPAGKFETFEGNELYVASPRPGAAHAHVGIVLATDVIGHRFANAQLIADQLAANGYLTVVPDLFDGDPVPLQRPASFDLQTWLAGALGSDTSQPHGVEQTEPRVQGAVKFLREHHSVRRVGGVGYCFGAKYVVRGLGVTGGIDVGFVAHPSLVDEDELGAIKQPLSIAAAETDGIFTVERRQKSEEILRTLKVPWQINLFSGVEHGFAVRGDPSKKHVRFAKEQAFCQAVNWFGSWLLE